MTAGEALEIAELRGWTGLAQVAASYLTLAAVHVELDDLAEAQRLLELGLSADRHPEKIMFSALKADPGQDAPSRRTNSVLPAAR